MQRVDETRRLLTLVDTTALVDQVAGSGRLAAEMDVSRLDWWSERRLSRQDLRIYVSDNDDAGARMSDGEQSRVYLGYPHLM